MDCVWEMLSQKACGEWPVTINDESLFRGMRLNLLTGGVES